MLEDQRKVVSSSFSNTEILNDYNIDNIFSDDYLETIAFKTIKRLLRCNPWSKGGFDPTPYDYKGVIKWSI